MLGLVRGCAATLSGFTLLCAQSRIPYQLHIRALPDLKKRASIASRFQNSVVYMSTSDGQVGEKVANIACACLMACVSFD
jgi:hypothetical protein